MRGPRPPEDTDWAGIEQLYGALERMQPSPVVTLNRAVAVSKVRGAADALAMIEPLAPKLGGYFYFHGARGAFLLELGRAEEARDRFRPRHRARQHARRGRPYPRSHRPVDRRRASQVWRPFIARGRLIAIQPYWSAFGPGQKKIAVVCRIYARSHVLGVSRLKASAADNRRPDREISQWSVKML